MIKYIFIILVLTSCREEEKINKDSQTENEAKTQIHKIKRDQLKIITIDSCEYILYKETQGSNHAYGYMAHKGNCKSEHHKK